MRVEMITLAQRRRHWSRAEKERIVAAAIEPGAVASEVARAAGIHRSQLSRWRRQFLGAKAPLSPDIGLGAMPAAPTESGAIEINFANGARMRITGPVDDSVIRAVITALAKARG
jgi:transposase